jgi:hypothetical protein
MRTVAIDVRSSFVSRHRLDVSNAQLAAIRRRFAERVNSTQFDPLQTLLSVRNSRISEQRFWLETPRVLRDWRKCRRAPLVRRFRSGVERRALRVGTPSIPTAAERHDAEARQKRGSRARVMRRRRRAR